MSVKLRLTRTGKKKQPFYKIVAVDSRNRRDGKYIEKIGHYNPLPDPVDVVINEDKALLWLNRGAIPSDTVRNLLSKHGVMLKWDLMKRGFDEAKIDEEIKKWEILQLEQKKKEEALAAQAKRESEDKKEEPKVEAQAKPEQEPAPAEEQETTAETVEPETKPEPEKDSPAAEEDTEKKESE